MPSDIITEWREKGYAVVPLLTAAEVADVQANISDYLPSWPDVAADADRRRELSHQAACRHTFPFRGDALNRVSTHPLLVEIAEELLRTDELMLNESQLIGKYAGTGDFEQELHVDYGNTTLVYPPSDDEITDLPMIAYYTDVTLDMGPTYVVPRSANTSGVNEPRHRSRAEAPELYEAEIPMTVPAGSVLVYSMNTWHRGSAFTAQAGVRFSHHLGFRRIDTPWCGQYTFVGDGGSAAMDAFLVGASPRARRLVGFPAPADPYWTERTLAGVAARYPEMDMAPYGPGAASL